MKRIFFILAPILFLLSCSSPRYVQLATLYSDSVSLSQGQYKYSDDIVCVEYMFNTEDDVFYYSAGTLILNDDRSPQSSDIKATDLNNKTVYLM